jgi:hypothetical protein
VIDPVSAFTLAVSAFNGVKKLVEAGREVEDVVGQLGKWYTAVADHKAASEQLKNPPLFRKLLHAGSIEQQALEITIHEQKFREQEKELREIIMYRYGQDVYLDMMRTRRRLKDEREKMSRRQIARRKSLVENTLLWGLLAVVLAVAIYAGAWLWSVIEAR